MVEKEIHALGIDVKTRDAKKLFNRLKKLKSTVDIEIPYKYWQDTSYSQINLTTTQTEAELENWLYDVSKLEYVGVFKQKTEVEREAELQRLRGN